MHTGAGRVGVVVLGALCLAAEEPYRIPVAVACRPYDLGKQREKLNDAFGGTAREIKQRDRSRAQRELIARLGLGSLQTNTAAAAVVGVGSEFGLVSKLDGTRIELRVRTDSNVARLNELLCAEADIETGAEHLFKGGEEDE